MSLNQRSADDNLVDCRSSGHYETVLIFKIMGFIRALFYLFLIVFTAIVSVAGYYAYTALKHKNPDTVLVKIPKGSSVRDIAARLKEENVIKDPYVFEAYLRVSEESGKLKAGEYEFEAGLGFDEIVVKMIEGRVKIYQFTVPEGYSIPGVCKILVEKKLMDEKTCHDKSRSVALLKDLAGAATLEGYLFPETYTYDSESTPAGVFKAMVDMFYAKAGAERVKKAKDKGMTLHELVTLASVIEKETGQASERPLIAGVFLNRLKIGMPLQSDPTTIYGLPHFNGNLTRRDLETDTPYNTYTRKGLPGGPICNPGLAALDAVLTPSPTKALYFVAKGDGSHYFSTTLGEHNQAVRYYQLKQGPAPQGN